MMEILRTIGKPVTEEEIWKFLRILAQSSNCLKSQTASAVVKDNKIIAFGVNSCAPEDHKYGDKLDNCPRMNIKTGAYYELCSPIHSEVMACLNIRPNRNSEEIKKFASHMGPSALQVRAAFTGQELKKLNGATIYEVGHYWTCQNCEGFLKAVGIVTVKLDKITGGEVRRSYEIKHLT